MSEEVEVDFDALFRRVRARLARTGWVAKGTVLERNAPGKGGPRYQWSRAVDGKTVTVALSPEQFEWLGKATLELRQAWDLLEEMQKASLGHMWKSLPGTSRRKRLTKKKSGIK